MKIVSYAVRNIIGLSELKLTGGASVELTGPTGAGKTSGLDALKFALTGTTGRSVTVREGAESGEVELILDDGTKITRKAYPGKVGGVKIQRDGMVQQKPQSFLNGIFTELQLDPVAFSNAKPAEQNRLLLDTVDFQWDLNWIKEKFGEIPEGVDLSKHILEVLAQIAAKNGKYYQSRQAINSDIRNKSNMAAEIASVIPEGFDFDRWDKYPVGDKYRALTEAQTVNAKIERARAFRDAYDGKRRGIESDYEIQCVGIDRQTEAERSGLKADIARMEAQIAAAKDKMQSLDNQALTAKQAAHEKMSAAIAELDKNTGVASEWADKETVDVSALQAEIDEAEEMRRHLNEYSRMKSMQEEVEKLSAQSQALTEKIELARRLPGQILKTAKLPIPDLTVDESGVPLIKGRPVSSLSDGEKMQLCVRIAAAKSGNLRVILLDGMERLDEKRRKELYRTCIESGLTVLATRVTDTDELAVNLLDVAFGESEAAE